MDLTKLNDQQREAVLRTEGPLLVLAGAGSGKTRVLTHRIAYLLSERGVWPREILALTFTNKAAAEMRERVERLVGESARDMWVTTFHAACARILRVEIEPLGYGKAFVIYDDADQQSLVKKIIKDLSLNDKIFTPRALLSKISDAKNHAAEPEAYLREAYEPAQVLDAYRAYQKALRANNALDFDDLLVLTLRLFRERAEVLEKYRRRFRYILVDEYQDTNMVQYEIVSLLASEHKNLCVVGDDDQSIYGWRGADIRNILEFEKDFPGAQVVRLEQNYRSTEAILSAANLVIANNRARKPKALWTDRAGGVPIELFEAQDEREEASHIANRILTGVRGGGRQYSDYAVLYRTHAQSRILEMYLKSFDIPYRVFGGLSFFKRAEVKDILCYLRLLHNPSDDLAFLRVVNVPRRGIGESALAALQEDAFSRGVPLFNAAAEPSEGLGKFAPKLKGFADAITDAYGKIYTEPLADAVEYLLAAIRYDTYLREDKKENYEARAGVVAELLGYMKEFTVGVNPDTTDPLAAFLESVALFSDTDEQGDEASRVSLMTLHNAKGLEFPAVFLTGLEEGLFPSMQSRYEPEKLAEERRLCYVGITRAMDELHLSFARQRMLYGRITPALPSMFLDELSEAIPKEEKKAPARPRAERYAAPASLQPQRPAEKWSAATAPRVPVTNVPAGSALTVSAGGRVRHKSFGEGTVLAVNGSGNNQIVEIAFDGGITKKFAAAYAPIEVL